MAAPKCKTCASGGTHTPDFKHGTNYAYTYHGCRCPECTAEHRACARKYYQNNRERVLEYRAGPRREALRTYNKKYYYENREEILRRCREDYDPEVLRERSARYNREHREYRRWQALDQSERRKDIPCPRNREPWLPKEDVIVMLDDVSVTEMCYLLERSYQAVLNRRRKLRAQQRVA